MSSLRATDLPSPSRTQRIRPLPTEQISRPRAVDPTVPVWADRLETALEVIARFGCAPTPTVMLLAVTAVGAALRHG